MICMAFIHAIPHAHAQGTSQPVDLTARTPDPSTSLSEFLAHAYQYNPDIISARIKVKAAEERLVQAEGGWKPTILGTADVLKVKNDGSNFGGADGSTSKDIGVSLSQPLYRGGRTLSQTAAAKHLIHAQQLALETRTQEVLLQIIRAYLDVMYEQGTLELATETRDLIAKRLEETDAGYEYGTQTLTDISQARARLAQADADVTEARGRLNAVRAVLNELSGLPAHNLEGVDIQASLPSNLETILQRVEQGNADILYAAALQKAAEEDVDSVFGELLPEINAIAGYNKTYDPQPGLLDEQSTQSIGISATLPLYKAGTTRSRVREAKYNARDLMENITSQRRESEREAKTLWAMWQSAKANIESRAAQVEAVEIAQEGVNAETLFGVRTTLDVLDADREVLNARTQLLQAVIEEIYTRFALLKAMADLTPDTLGLKSGEK